jgi:hypothetical protein
VDPPSSDAESPGPSGALRELLDWLPNNIATLPTLLGIGGVLAYGALNVASTIFYQGLGVTPSAVGLGYGELLARVAVIAGIVAITAFVVAVLVSVVVRFGIRLGGMPRCRRGARRKLAIVGGTAILALAVVIGVLPPIDRNPSLADVFALAVFGSLVGIWVLVGVLALDKELATLCDLEWRHILVAAAVWLVLAPLSFVAHAMEGRGEVQDGRTQRESLFGSPFPWQAAVANVAWREGSKPPEVSECLLYLGSSSSVAVLYDATSEDQRSIQVPTADVTVEVFPEKTPCSP